jgi:hypothetical protein
MKPFCCGLPGAMQCQPTPASPLAHVEGRGKMRHGFRSGGGRHHFFPKRSFSAALSSMASASIRFSRPFSSSSPFSRRGS